MQQAQQAAQQQQQAQLQQMQQQAQMEQQRAALEMQQSQRQMNSPTIEQLGMMSIQEKAKLDAANMAIKARDSETKFVDTMAKLEMQGIELDQKEAEMQAENSRQVVRSLADIAEEFARNKATDEE